MQLPHQSASGSLPVAQTWEGSRNAANLAYQSLTLAAMLLLLASLWAF